MKERDDFDVAGLRVLVTGSSRGLGREIAGYLAEHGAMLAVHGRDADRAEAVRASIAEKGGVAVAVLGDVRTEADRIVREAAEALGGLDGLVNNAGGSFGAAAADLTPNGFASVVAINLNSPFVVSREALPYLTSSRGSIVNIGSVSGLRPSPMYAHYGAAKAGLANLTRSLAAEWGPAGVRVNAVFPGAIASDAALESVFGNDPAQIAQAEAKIGVGRLGTPRDVAMAVRYLLSPAAAYVHGEILVVDGGPPSVLPY